MRNRDARVAGLLYALAIVIGLFTLMYLPDRLITPGDAAATARTILTHEFLLRLAMAGDILAGVVWLFVVLALYRLLHDVDPVQAALMVILGAYMQVPLYFVNVVNYAAALLLVKGAPYLAVFSEAQRYALTMVFLRLHHYELLASLLFAGLWLFPFGILVFKSRFLPRFLGIWLAVNGLAFLLVCFGGFLTPQYGSTIDAITSPLLTGEIAITSWLLIFGARTFGRI
ncbi:MAG TPA: DUF4386 domain-containing protein [Candidatus Cybelea sp.]